jgi:hypothetical protein
MAEIPLAFNPDRTIEATADAMKERLTPVVMLGFQRESSWQLSADKRTLRGTITDTEIPVPLPDGLAFIEAHHEAHSGLLGSSPLDPKSSRGFYTWDHSVRGTARMPRNMTKAQVWQRVHLVLGQLLSWARDAGGAGAGLPPVIAAGGGFGGPSPDQTVVSGIGAGLLGGGALLPGAFGVPGLLAGAGLLATGNPVTSRGVFMLELRIGEQLFGDQIDFAMTYAQVGSSLHNILNDGGFFRPFPFASWTGWRNSMDAPGAPFDVRGGAQLAYSPSMEGTVIDLCTIGRTAYVPVVPQETDPPPGSGTSSPYVPYTVDPSIEEDIAAAEAALAHILGTPVP